MKRLIHFMMTGIVALCSVLPQGMTVLASEEEQVAVSGEIEVLMNQSYEVMKEYIDGFEQKYPGVEVKFTDYSDYENEAAKRIQSGDYGDVLLIPGAIQEKDCQKYLEPLGTFQQLNLKYNFIDQGKKRDKTVYGIPSYAYLSGIAYNREVFDEAGITKKPDNINEFISDMQLIREHTDAIPFYTNYMTDWALLYWENFPYIEMTGNATYKYSTFIYEENPFKSGSTHYEVYRMLYDMVSLGFVEEDLKSISWEESKAMLNDGRIGCVAIGSWAVSQFKDAGPNADNIEFMPFPNSIDGKKYVTISADYCYGIASNSKNKAAAHAFVDYMLDESGYALDKDNLSVLRTDPYPDSFGTMENVVLLGARGAATDKDYNTYATLSKNLEPGNATEIKRIIDAGAGLRNESFDDIMQDWNTRWEASRTEEMKQDIKSVSFQANAIFMDNSKVMLSEAEEVYISEHPYIRVGYLQNFAPFSYEIDGEPRGLAFEMCRIIEESTGLQLQYRGYPNTEAAVAALQSGDIDMVAAMEKFDDKSARLKYSREYFSYMNVLAKRPSVDSMNLTDAKAAVVSGEQNFYSGDEDKQEVYDTISDCIMSVQREKTDYTATNYYSANYYITDNECDRVDIVPSTSSSTLHLGFLKSADTTLVALCNKCVYSTSQNSMQVALLKYIDPPQKQVTLRRIIETNPMLCIGVLSSFFIVSLIFVLIIMQQRKKVAVYTYREKAQRDPLTKLYNRNGFHAGLPIRASEVMFAVLDMDNFKSVNDSLGHEGGDCALVKLARTLEADLGENALICRYGGDEFMVFLEGVGADEADSRLRKLVRDMDTELTFEGKTHKLSISVGAVYSEMKMETEGLFKKADEILYQTKAEGKNGYHINIVG